MAERRRNPVVRLIDVSFVLVVGLYGVVTLLFLALRLIYGDSWWPVALYNTLAHLLWMPAFIFLLLALTGRKWLLALLMVIPVAAFAASYVWALPPASDRDAYGTELTVVTFNILRSNADYSEQTAVIRSANADIVAIQELTQSAADRFERDLSDVYPYQALYSASGYEGQGVLSRIPIEDSAYWRSSVVPVSFGYQRVVVTVGPHPVVIYNVHLLHPFAGNRFFDTSYRSLEVSDLLANTLAEDGNVILLGDFNMNDLNDDHARITEFFTDAYVSAGAGLGWTHSTRIRGIQLPPLMRLDYIFYDGPNLRSLHADVVAGSGGSDHHPVRAVLDIYDPTLSYPN